MTEEVESTQPTQPSPGAMLREGREAMGLSAAQIATALNLKPALIENIEQDVFDKTMSETFTRGYLKTYAKQVKVDEASVLTAYESLNPSVQDTNKLTSFSRRVSKETDDNRLMLVTYLILAGLIGALFWWWYQSSSDDGATTEVPAVMESLEQQSDYAQQDTLADPVTTQPEPFTAAPATQLPLPAEATQQSSLESDNQDTLTETRDAPLTDVQEQASLVFTFAADCWVNITDASGERIAYGTKKAGRVMTIAGVPPFEVTLGAPQVVKLTYNGEAVDMSRYPGSEIARFNLPVQD